MDSDRLIPSDLVKTEIQDSGEDETDCIPANHRPDFLLDTFRTTNQGQATGSNPTIESWPGPRNFRIEIEDFGNWKKRGYTFSRELNKLFIEMGKPVAVRFNIDPSLSSDPEDEATLIRALPVYVDIAYRASPVVRCPVHSAPGDASNRGLVEEMVSHLVRTLEPGASYQRNEASGRLSVVTGVRETAPGCDYFSLVYQFMCLGSCNGGLARRPISLVFSLENKKGVVLGRQSLEVRICTCPLRDMQQEETRNSKKDALAANISHNLASGVKNNGVKPRTSVSNPQHSAPQTISRPYNDSDNVFFVPVRGFANFQKVNKFAEFLDLTDGHDGDCYNDQVQKLRAERNKLVQTSNPSVQTQSQSSSSTEIQSPSPPKRLCIVTGNNITPSTVLRPPMHPRANYIVPIMPKPEQRTVKGLLMGNLRAGPVRRPLPGANTTMLPRTTIILPPRPPLGQGRSHNDVKVEPKVEDNEEEDEGEDLPDSLGAFVKEDIQDPDDPDPGVPDDGIAEFQRTVSF